MWSGLKFLLNGTNKRKQNQVLLTSDLSFQYYDKYFYFMCCDRCKECFGNESENHAMLRGDFDFRWFTLACELFTRVNIHPLTAAQTKSYGKNEPDFRCLVPRVIDWSFFFPSAELPPAYFSFAIFISCWLHLEALKLFRLTLLLLLLLIPSLNFKQ